MPYHTVGKTQMLNKNNDFIKLLLKNVTKQQLQSNLAISCQTSLSTLARILYFNTYGALFQVVLYIPSSVSLGSKSVSSYT